MSGHNSNDVLPTSRAADLALAPDEGRWLIDRVWSAGVGIIGGTPKSAKSWLGLEMAVSVASNTPFLGRFHVHDPGPTLIYLAEDTLTDVRGRIAGICAHRQIDLNTLNVHVITAPAVRLDNLDDQRRLATTIEKLAPKLLLLDPLVRLHRIDENSSGEISSLLGYLREQQRRHLLAIVLAHHMAKRVRAQLGQALRGSGDLHAWLDHGAYLTRSGDKLRLTLEHRAAAAPDPLDLHLVSLPDETETHLELCKQEPAPATANGPVAATTSLHDLVLDALRRAHRPMSRGELRTLLHVNNNRLGEVLADLEHQRRILRSDAGITLT